jgi:hypothetical protein
MYVRCVIVAPTIYKLQTFHLLGDADEHADYGGNLQEVLCSRRRQGK